MIILLHRNLIAFLLQNRSLLHRSKSFYFIAAGLLLLHRNPNAKSFNLIAAGILLHQFPLYFTNYTVGSLTVFSTLFGYSFTMQAGPYDNLKDIAMKILQKEVSTVPIIHSSSEDGSFPQLLHLASLSGILKCICRYFRNCSSSLPILQLPICAIPVGTWVPKIGESNRRPLAVFRPSSSLASALNLLVQAQASSIPIVDDNDSLLDIYCRSDIMALAKAGHIHISILMK
ncbi:hypothetical protein P8452_60716 [Trifolium repens]|nr:hypothetical protein P8452_60716 [Trifolium repens]